MVNFLSKLNFTRRRQQAAVLCVFIFTAALFLLQFPSSRGFLPVENKLSSGAISTIEIEEENSSLDPRGCTFRRKFAFAKTHKTASSSIQNILLRLSSEEGLNAVLPAKSNHLNDPSELFVLRSPFKIEWLDKVPWHGRVDYDVSLLHSVWNASAFRSLLGPEAVFFTVLRDPVDAFESLFVYSNMRRNLGGIELAEYIDALSQNRSFPRVPNLLGLNQQSWDLGVDEADFDSAEKMKEKAVELDRDFDLVLIAEKMDESLVLLAHLLCVPLSRVTSLPINVRKKQKKVKLSDFQKTRLRKRLKADETLYAHFSGRLEKRIEKFGVDKMRSAVAALRRENEALKEKCKVREMNEEDRRSEKGFGFAPVSDDVIAYDVESREDPHCVLTALSENSFVDEIRRKQRLRWILKEAKDEEREKTGV